ncbi:hypothetical protein K458DRAFT_408195 [Lentithecium fluviatile CBS 122367]|uniref:Uncharacterized protein n=1 Tax=Lentithecium fluviatile CBS 122367 TaxID=1168545 RepID=A0A6G1IML4_9PLEO|nr:hypothetical protein K458DRAFT_408195 [Lentithecium fluviatile CBS 122367]
MVHDATLAEDIEDFALNASISILNDFSLCVFMPANVTSTTVSSVYIFQPPNLLIAYGVTIALSALLTIAGVYAFYVSSMSYETTPTSFGMAMQNPEITRELRDMYATKKELTKKRARETKVKLDRNEGFVVQSRQYKETWTRK